VKFLSCRLFRIFSKRCDRITPIIQPISSEVQHGFVKGFTKFFFEVHCKNSCVTFHTNPVFESSNRICVNSRVAADDVRQPLHQKIIDFLDELELFIGEKPIFTKKKSVAMPSAVIMTLQIKNVVRPLFERSFQVRNFSFGSLKELV
jgi:hypothetical protein